MHRDYTYFLKKNRKKRRKRNEIISCSKPNKFVRKQSMRKLDQTICTEQAFLPSPPPSAWLRVEIEFTIIYD